MDRRTHGEPALARAAVLKAEPGQFMVTAQQTEPTVLQPCFIEHRRIGRAGNCRGGWLAGHTHSPLEMGFRLVAKYTQRFFARGPAAVLMSVRSLKMAVQSLARLFLALYKRTSYPSG